MECFLARHIVMPHGNALAIKADKFTPEKETGVAPGQIAAMQRKGGYK